MGIRLYAFRSLLMWIVLPALLLTIGSCSVTAKNIVPQPDSGLEQGTPKDGQAKASPEGKCYENTDVEVVNYFLIKGDCFAGNGKQAACKVVDEPGWREVILDKLLVEYYIPQSNKPKIEREILVLIHGAGDCHVKGAITNINEWRDWADKHNVVLLSPIFDRIFTTQNHKYLSDFYKFDGPNPKYYQEAPCAYAMQLECIQDAKFAKTKRYPFGYKMPDPYLYGFIFLNTKKSPYLSDLKLNEIFAHFHLVLGIKEDRFSLWGYSGGGQFVSRYMMLYPENLKRVALGGAGSHLFPKFEPDFPFGLGWHYAKGRWYKAKRQYKMYNRFQPFYSTAKGAGGDWVNLNANRTVDEWYKKIATLLDLKIYLFAGTEDYLGADTHPASAWQGYGQLEKAYKYTVDMERMDKELKDKGYRPPDAPFHCRLIPLIGLDHGKARGQAVKWLQKNWW